MLPPGETSPSGPVAGIIVGLCDEAVTLLAPAARGAVAGLRASMTEPLRVALVGRVSAGKSTLVNALIGRRMAPTAAGECTQVVTWYRFGAPDRAELVLRDGTVRPLPFDRSLPERLPVDPTLVERIEVRLQSGLLRRMTLIDTPGLGSPDRPGDEPTRRVSIADERSVQATAQASALLFLFRDVEKQDDIEFIRAHRAATAASGTTAAGIIGVLSHADLFGAGPWTTEDPLVDARVAADRIARDHRTLLTAVTPVAALMAQAARTGAVDESTARTLAALAPVPTVRLQMLPRFGMPPGMDPAEAERLLRELGPYAVNRARHVAAAGAAAVQNWLVDHSGIAEAEILITRRFLGRTVPLAAERVLRGLSRLSRREPLDHEAGERLRDRIEQVELSPQMHRIAELRALQLLAGCRGAVAAEMSSRLERMIDGDTLWQRIGAAAPLGPEDLRSELNRHVERAQAVIVTARDPAVGDAARVLTRSYAIAAGET